MIATKILKSLEAQALLDGRAEMHGIRVIASIRHKGRWRPPFLYERVGQPALAISVAEAKGLVEAVGAP